VTLLGKARARLHPISGGIAGPHFPNSLDYLRQHLFVLFSSPSATGSVSLPLRPLICYYLSSRFHDVPHIRLPTDSLVVADLRFEIRLL
jgi:hypothetical protein